MKFFVELSFYVKQQDFNLALIFPFSKNSDADSDHIASGGDCKPIIMTHAHAYCVERIEAGKASKVGKCCGDIGEVFLDACFVVNIAGHSHNATDACVIHGFENSR